MTSQNTNRPGGLAAIVNGRIVMPDRILEGHALVVDGRRIGGIVAADELGADVQRIDAGGRYVTPGLIDIHTHGCMRHTFNEPTAEAFGIIAAENARRGVTSLLATLVPAPIADLCACLEFCREWMGAPAPGAHPTNAQILGAHLESPCTSPAQKGALDPASLLQPGDERLAPLLDCADVLRIFVLAPELPGALDLVENLAGRGIIPAAGHSSAYDSHVAAAMAHGLRHVTHIWSAQSSTVREGPWRKPGLLEASLAFDGLMVEMICDNRHLPPTLMKLAYKCIGPDRLCAVSDATSGAGLPDGARFRMGALEYDVQNGVGMTLDRTSFGGSATLLNQMPPILVREVGVPLPEAVRMASLTPARAIGVADRKGSIEAGKDADIAIFDEDFNAWKVMIGGRWVEQVEHAD